MSGKAGGRNMPGREKDGYIAAIQRFSLHDGPGIRTTVFFKGCNLKCIWCHNPETIHRAGQIMFYADRCIGCGKCVQACEKGCHTISEGHFFDRECCIACGKCAAVCPPEALEMVGEARSAAEVMDEILKDMFLYRSSKGGATFSGGEPLLQPDFLLRLLKECKSNKIHTAVDTAGNVPWKVFESVIPYTDLFLYDFKAHNREKHSRLTGQSNEVIFENLAKLPALAEVIVRMPLVAGLNDSEEDMEGAAALLKKSGIKKVDILKYHGIHRNKYTGLGLKAPELSPPDDERVNEIGEFLAQCGFEVKIQ